jgi:hypothetical protein
MTHPASVRGMRCLCHSHMTILDILSRGAQNLSQFAVCSGQGQLILLVSRSKRGLISPSPTSSLLCGSCDDAKEPRNVSVHTSDDLCQMQDVRSFSL